MKRKKSTASTRSADDGYPRVEQGQTPGRRQFAGRRDTSGTGRRHRSAGVRVALQPLQIGAHVRGVLVTQVAVFLQRLVDDALQLDGRSGFSRTGGVGSRSRIALKISAEVSPRNGSVPVAISYSTTPKENRSVRASSSLPRACSGDM